MPTTFSSLQKQRGFEPLMQFRIKCKKLMTFTLQMRQNIGVACDGETDQNEAAAVQEQMTPPLQMLSPWAFKVCDIE